MFERNLYFKKIEPFLGKPIIKVISGIRRSGKSTFLKLLQKELVRKGVPAGQILLINMESMEFEDIRDHRDLHKYVKAFFSLF